MPDNKRKAAASSPHGGLRADAARSWRNLNTGRLLYGGFEYFEAAVLAALHEADYGHVRRTHFNVLRHLDAEGTRMSDLAARANVTKAAMTALVRACEEMGFVTVTIHKGDGRARLVNFTATGDELMRFFENTILASERVLRARLGKAGYESLRAGLLELSGMTDVVAFGPTRAASRRRAG